MTTTLLYTLTSLLSSSPSSATSPHTFKKQNLINRGGYKLHLGVSQDKMRDVSNEARDLQSNPCL